MKRLVFLLSFFCLCVMAVMAQQYVVLSVTGRVETDNDNNQKHELLLRERLDANCFLTVPHKGQVLHVRME